MSDLNLRQWTFRGRKLAPIHTIARRMIAIPMLRIGEIVVFVASWIGWGLDEAVQAWEDMP